MKAIVTPQELQRQIAKSRAMGVVKTEQQFLALSRTAAKLARELEDNDEAVRLSVMRLAEGKQTRWQTVKSWIENWQRPWPSSRR